MISLLLPGRLPEKIFNYSLTVRVSTGYGLPSHPFEDGERRPHGVTPIKNSRFDLHMILLGSLHLTGLSNPYLLRFFQAMDPFGICRRSVPDGVHVQVIWSLLLI